MEDKHTLSYNQNYNFYPFQYHLLDMVLDYFVLCILYIFEQFHPKDLHLLLHQLLNHFHKYLFLVHQHKVGWNIDNLLC